MTAHEAACALIRGYVERGDDPAFIRSGGLGYASDQFWASIGGYLGDKHYSSDWILVTKLNGKEVAHAYKFWDIYQLLKQGQGVLL